MHGRGFPPHCVFGVCSRAHYMVGKERMREYFVTWCLYAVAAVYVRALKERGRFLDELEEERAELGAKYDELEMRHEDLVETVPQLVEFNELKEACQRWEVVSANALAEAEQWKARAEKAEKELAEKVVRNPFGRKGKPKKLSPKKSTAPASPRRVSPRADGKRPERGTPPKKKRGSRLKWGQNRVTKFTALGELNPLPEYCQPKKAGRMSYGEYMAR